MSYDFTSHTNTKRNIAAVMSMNTTMSISMKKSNPKEVAAAMSNKRSKVKGLRSKD
jgi:hypothetical protein